MGFRIFSKTVMIAGLAFGVAACGGGGGGGGGTTGGGATTPTSPTGASLSYIILTSGSASLPKGISEQFIATGIYSDGTKQNLTASATWSSSNPAVATISNSGVATAVGAGTAKITATAGIASLSYTLTVTTAALNYISVTPPAPTVGAGQTRQFTATGTFSDSSTLDITSNVSWSSSNISIANVNSTAPAPMGLASGLTPGTVIITATNWSGTNSILASTTLTVAGYGASGLLSLLPAGKSVVLQNNLADDVTLNADGTFMFNAPLATGATYNVTVLTQPTGVHPCNVVDGSGMIATSPVTSIQVVCATAVGTFAGTPHVYGTTNGPGSSASFYNPSGVAYDATSGNLYVADTASQVIRVITPTGVVSTLAGTAGMAGFANGTGTAASFFNPTGVAVDANGNVYVADSGNNAIRKITMPGAVVSTLAGSGLVGATNAVGTSASFDNPNGVAVDTVGNVYVADTYNYLIRKITPTGSVSTFAGAGKAATAFSDGPALQATFYFPSGVAAYAGNVYVADSGGGRIRLISGGQVTTFAGAPMSGLLDGPATSVSFSWPVGIAVDALGNVYVGDRGYHLIRKISAGNVTTYAGLTHYMGTSTGSSGFHDGPAWIDASNSSSAFNSPSGVAVDAAGNVYVADTSNHLIRKIMP
jgi:sugar lactone lactonase YvrE